MLITNAQVVTFSNQSARPLADEVWDLYWKCKQLESSYFSQGIGDAITAGGATNLVQDGAAPLPLEVPSYNGDGRTPLLGSDLVSLIGIAQALATTLEASGRLGVLSKIKTGT